MQVNIRAQRSGRLSLCKKGWVIGIFLLCQNSLWAQTPKDSTKPLMSFSGSLGFTNNGFSIIPTFSFNSPAAIVLLSWKKNKFSIDPDIRITPNGKKGSMLLWFRYYPIQGNKFALRVGAHPAMNWMPTQITNNGTSTEVVKLRRFLAWELSPGYRISQHWSVGLYYLQGNGMQKDGPQTTHFINLNTTVSNVKISRNMSFAVTPALFYLKLDDTDGTYFTATAAINHKKIPFTIQSTINKTIRSTIAGNKDFLWNVVLFYNFRKTLH
jgi:hypothetical protein